MHLICNWRPLEPVSTNSSGCCLLSTRVVTCQIISWPLDPIKNTKQLPCVTFQKKKLFDLYFLLGNLPLSPPPSAPTLQHSDSHGSEFFISVTQVKPCFYRTPISVTVTINMKTDSKLQPKPFPQPTLVLLFFWG